MQLFPSGLGNRSLANTMPPGTVTGKAWNWGAKRWWSFMGKQEGKYLEKCQPAPLPDTPLPPSSLWKFLLAGGSRDR